METDQILAGERRRLFHYLKKKKEEQTFFILKSTDPKQFAPDQLSSIYLFNSLQCNVETPKQTWVKLGKRKQRKLVGIDFHSHMIRLLSMLKIYCFKLCQTFSHCTSTDFSVLLFCCGKLYYGWTEKVENSWILSWSEKVLIFFFHSLEKWFVFKDLIFDFWFYVFYRFVGFSHHFMCLTKTFYWNKKKGCFEKFNFNKGKGLLKQFEFGGNLCILLIDLFFLVVNSLVKNYLLCAHQHFQCI